jgi:glycosyltransferase involved in cell wall biosynthesis
MDRRRPPLRIAFLINELRHAGAQRVLVDDANRFSRAGAEVLFCLLYRDPGVPSIVGELDAAVERVVLDARGPFDRRAVLRCAKLLRSRGIDTLITTLNDANIVGRWVALACGSRIRLLRRESNTPRRKPLWQQALDALFDGLTYRIIAVTDDMRREIERRSPWRAARVTVIHNAVATPALAAVHPHRHALRILSVGRLTAQKDHRVLVAALGILARNGYVFDAHIVGDGDLLATLRDGARLEGIAERIAFRGMLPHEDVLREYVDADIFVLPSRWEGCPNVVLEAMAHGVPVVATTVGGVTELVEHGVSGILVPPQDPRALADALASLARDRQRRVTMGAAARERSRRFTPEARFERLYRLVTMGREVPQATVSP